MGQYTVITGQNLYDVALDIYGSIEGITDLLLSNPALSMMSELRAGQTLDYSDGVLIDARGRILVERPRGRLEQEDLVLAQRRADTQIRRSAAV